MVPNRRHLLRIALTALSLTFTASAVHGKCIDCFPRPQNGIVTEFFPGKAALVTIWITDSEGNDIIEIFTPPLSGFPKEELIGTNFKTTISFDIPTEGFDVSREPPRVEVRDVRQTVEVLLNSGETSDLRIESIVFDSGSGQFALANIFGTLTDRVGFGREIFIPDLYADTNGDGVIGEGDILYSLVDLNVYLNSVPLFNIGDPFTITNGTSVGLPGMRFSTTPFVFDPAVGFLDPPFSGSSIAASRHGIKSVAPEPSSLKFAGPCLIGLLIWHLRRYFGESYWAKLSSRRRGKIG